MDGGSENRRGNPFNVTVSLQNQPWLQRNRIMKPLPSPLEMARQVQEQLRSWAAMRTRDAAEVDKVRSCPLIANICNPLGSTLLDTYGVKGEQVVLDG